MQPRCSRDAAEMQPRCGRDAAEMRRYYLTHAHKTAMALWTHGGDPWTKKQGNGVGTTQWVDHAARLYKVLH